tara:strand:+ start:318 stop:1316 length:999 start_codon:yes stop_codon:yes gene_type:complete
MNDAFESETRRRLTDLLDEFQQSASPGPFNYGWVHQHDGKHHGLHVAFGCMVHGNEFGSLPAALRLIAALRSGAVTFGGKVTVFIGNPEAALENRRYLEADLNRAFLPSSGDTHEARRAQELMPILDAADVLIDFHQTILDTAYPFYISAWNPQAWHWARATQATPLWVTRNPTTQFSSGTKCTDEYVCDRGRPGMTLELSEKGFSADAEDLCWTAMCNALRVADAVSAGAPIETLASSQPDFQFMTTVYAEPFDTPAKMLRSGLVNFQKVEAGEPLHAEGTPPMIAPRDGALLFPKYPTRESDLAVAPWPNEVYRLIVPMGVHPTQRWPAP